MGREGRMVGSGFPLSNGIFLPDCTHDGSRNIALILRRGRMADCDATLCHRRVAQAVDLIERGITTDDLDEAFLIE